MSSRTQPTNTSQTKFAPVGTPDVVNSAVNVSGITAHAFEVWADGTIWDTTAGAAVCVDKFNITGTPRKRA